jgi:beta-1,4-mannosyl-glycoprotein beta-1,4-N-acetylglucosaminyltransferase
MSRIIDSFLFFQELDLLEVRLEYLYEKVDKFIILESCQTFTGGEKSFYFEDNKKRFEKYLDKIIYYKLEDFHDSYESVIKFLKTRGDKASGKVINILEAHTHYPKDTLHWVLDTYHRESLHIVYDMYLLHDDIIILSDLDEIPSHTVFDNIDANLKNKPIVCQQHEFKYFLNYYSNSSWLGSIFSKYKYIQDLSLNELRIDSKKVREVVEKREVKNGGYHFTSVGNIAEIRKKINSWGHQEFNTKGIVNRLEYNIETGQDIFEREYGTKMRKVNFNDRIIFDESMAVIICKYNDLVAKNDIKFVGRYSPYNLYRKAYSKLKNIKNRLAKKISE